MKNIPHNSSQKLKSEEYHGMNPAEEMAEAMVSDNIPVEPQIDAPPNILLRNYPGYFYSISLLLCFPNAVFSAVANIDLLTLDLPLALAFGVLFLVRLFDMEAIFFPLGNAVLCGILYFLSLSFIPVIIFTFAYLILGNTCVNSIKKQNAKKQLKDAGTSATSSSLGLLLFYFSPTLFLVFSLLFIELFWPNP